MIITLNDELQVVERRATWSYETPERRLQGVHSSLQYKIEERAPVIELVRELPMRDAYFTKGFMDMASEAYSYHYGLTVEPHNLWYIVLTQLCEMIHARPEDYRDLFTKSESKPLILVQQDHPTDININALIAELKPYIPADANLFLPELSTHTDKSRIACAAAFADAMTVYYDYGMFCCGIPRVKLTGTVEDWTLLQDNAMKLRSMFADNKNFKAANYLERVASVMSRIVATFYRDDQNLEFWQDIFTQKNVGSGGDKIVDGWLAELYGKTKRGDMLRSFHNTLSYLPYKNVSTGEDFIMVHGALYADTTDDIITAQYDHATFQLKQS